MVGGVSCVSRVGCDLSQTARNAPW